jgi:hypothetical protein
MSEFNEPESDWAPAFIIIDDGTAAELSEAAQEELLAPALERNQDTPLETEELSTLLTDGWGADYNFLLGHEERQGSNLVTRVIAEEGLRELVEAALRSEAEITPTLEDAPFNLIGVVLEETGLDDVLSELVAEMAERN